MTETSRRALKVKLADVGQLTALDHYVAFAATSRRRPVVMLLDRETSRFKVVDRLDAGELVAGLAGEGSWLVWVEQDHIQSSFDEPVRWRLISYNVDSGRHRTVFTESVADPDPPVPSVSSGRVAWTRYRGSAKAGTDLFIADLATGRTRQLAAGQPIGQATLSEGRVVFARIVKVDQATETVEQDLFEMPAGGGKQHRITRTGDAQLPAFGGGVLTWQRRAASHLTIMAQWPNADTEEVISESSRGWQRATESFVAFLGADSTEMVVVAPMDDPTRSLTLKVTDPTRTYCVPCGIATGGEEVMWGTYGEEDGGRSGTTIFISTMGTSS